MNARPSRLDAEAACVRRDAPSWFIADRLPWWAWALLGLGFGARGVFLLLAGSGLADVLTGAGLVLLVAPAQFLAARRRYRGESFW